MIRFWSTQIVYLPFMLGITGIWEAGMVRSQDWCWYNLIGLVGIPDKELSSPMIVLYFIVSVFWLVHQNLTPPSAHGHVSNYTKFLLHFRHWGTYLVSCHSMQAVPFRIFITLKVNIKNWRLKLNDYVRVMMFSVWETLRTYWSLFLYRWVFYTPSSHVIDYFLWSFGILQPV